MNTVVQEAANRSVRSDVHRSERMDLYDRYGSMAYGIILQIIPQPELAQSILVDLFSSMSLGDNSIKSERIGSLIIRQAREKALAARPGTVERSLTSFKPAEQNLPKVVFNLLFWHGYKPEEVAERLRITTTDVLKAIRMHVRSFNMV